MKKRLVIVDDHKIIRDGLIAIFKRNRHFEIVADFDNEEDLLNFLKGNLPDIILMDIHLTAANGIEIAKTVKQKYSDVKIIMHTMSDDNYNIEKAQMAGVEGYVLKSSGQKILESAIEIVANGGRYYTNELDN